MITIFFVLIVCMPETFLCSVSVTGHWSREITERESKGFSLHVQYRTFEYYGARINAILMFLWFRA